MFGTLPVSWSELARRTWREALDDDILGLAAQLAYYLFLALFPAILFLLALASFFPLSNITDDVARSIGPFVSPQVLELIQDQMRRLGEGESGGLLTFGVAGALWSSSAAMVSIVAALNKAYDIEEGRPWWKVRLVSIGLTVGASLFVLVAFSLVLVGPTLADWLGDATGWGRAFEWTWLVLQWPLVFALVATAIGLVYYFAPDAEQDWSWITPGALVATLLWLVVSLLFKVYIVNFTDYNATYGAVGGVIVLLLWFYVSSLAILVGAELNAEIEHASPYGKAPGQKSAQGKLLLGRRAERAFRDLQTELPTTPKPVSPTMPDRKPRPAAGAAFVGAILLSRLWHRARGRRGTHPLTPAAVGSRRESPMTQHAQSPALRELFGAVSEDLRMLVSQTIALARLEFASATSALVTSVVGVALSLIIVLGGIGVLMSALVLIGIALGLPAWAAATGVGLVLAIGGALSARQFLGKARSVSVTLSETRESIKETMEWLKTQAND